MAQIIGHKSTSKLAVAFVQKINKLLLLYRKANAYLEFKVLSGLFDYYKDSLVLVTRASSYFSFSINPTANTD